ncbi:hypothetical protein [Leptospira noguchii]|nr:hypothetical protein [Leptospira noguchii]UOG53768.1 hypothetical protein MAL09_06500 [Leptospira noguchii]
MSHFNYEICERFAPIFLRRTHVKLKQALGRKFGFSILNFYKISIL